MDGIEEILSKNIFNDKELTKLSPDYTPSNTLLRLQTRSTMVKDTHSHKYKNESLLLQRKIIKRPKDCYKISKEIAKIRNSYQILNLKNQIMLKNAVKYVDTLKLEDFGSNFDEVYDALGAETRKYLQSISETKDNLIIQNRSDFKLEDKPKAQKPINEKKKRINKSKKDDSMVHDNNEANDDVFAVQDFLRIECTLHKSENISNDDLQTGNDLEKTIEIVEKELSDETVNYPFPQTEIESDVNNLQSLLIMMTLSPKSVQSSNETGDHGPCHDGADMKHKSTESIVNVVLPPKLEVEPKTAEMFLSINPLRIEIKDKLKDLLRKFVEKWKAYVLRRKEEKAQEREETLNSFFYKLEKKKNDVTDSPECEPQNKAKTLARDFNRYRHRYQVQKHIIALQKAKLEEQSRIIEELKYNRIVEASKISIDAMKDEIRKTYNDIDKQLKPKLKCLTNELKLNDIEEPSLVLHCLKVPQFLQRMEKRAREREEKHAIIRERRKQMEEERIKLKQQEELARALMDKEEKIKRIKELRDKRKREKIEGIRKKQHVERMRALTVMAELHYEKNLMAKYGIRPFKLLLSIKRDNIEKSKSHYKFQLKKNVFLNWMFYTEDMWYERNYKADDFYRKNLLRQVFKALKSNHNNYVLKRQVADDYYDLYVMNLVFKKFKEAVHIAQAEAEIKWKKAVLYHNCDILFKTFTCWRTLPALNALRREQEARKARWREKVLQVVPDYTPPED